MKGNFTDRSKLHNLLKFKHRNVVPYTSSDEDDVWDALINLDSSTSNNNNSSTKQVYLIYSDTYINAEPKGQPDTWNREHLWPRSRGVGKSGPDNTDLHHLRPSLWSVNSARGNKYFSRCDVVNPLSTCSQPAHPDAASSSTSDYTTFCPPEANRGDVARSVLYMELRYDGDEDNVMDLTLTDCPRYEEHDMAYLSELLAWHEEDPVDEEERRRNENICSRWQGNRNPFVDYPELVSIYFGHPKEVRGELGYDCPSPAPTIDDGENNEGGGSCVSLGPGDVMLTGVRSSNPDAVAMVALKDLPGGMELYMTDNAWTGSNFKTNEGTVKFVVPQQGISQGTVFGYGDDSLKYANLWERYSGSFALSNKGDNIFIYCYPDTIDGSSSGIPVHLTGLIYNDGGWSEDVNGEGSLSTQQSVLPKALSNNTHVELPYYHNHVYIGIRDGHRKELLRSLSGAKEWKGSNDQDFDVISNQTEFIVEDSSVLLPGPGDVMLTGVRS
eukprot:CAMPEP_0172491482 /NCGR_PEP_ID=MMETSP1066-20121228/22324_1 /TAXON_ID=671091 /ORGANISM="Coscinodiscus wailesii, Strain CCMP2513" /LENGTH=497 /DNA_ID=CAMNT_0013260555 /DNA_START=192 /DNA_END=1681 /DNA_ORIENTATION=+